MNVIVSHTDKGLFKICNKLLKTMEYGWINSCQSFMVYFRQIKGYEYHKILAD